MSNKKGFTLIELLVVIAIIGVLSSVVLSSLNSARTKGNDAKVKAQLSGLRAAAEVYYDSNAQAYSPAGTANNTDVTTTLCPVAGITGEMGEVAPTNAYLNLSNYPSGTTIKCTWAGATVSTGATSYVVTASLGTSGQFFCVDSSGNAKQTTAVQANGDTVCP